MLSTTSILLIAILFLLIKPSRAQQQENWTLDGFFDLTSYNELLYGIAGTDEPAKQFESWPWNPKQLATRFHLFDKNHRNSSVVIAVTKGGDLKNASKLSMSYDRLFVVAHGWGDEISNPLWIVMKDRMLDYRINENPAVILVDWEKGAAAGTPASQIYSTPALNTMVVGRQLGLLAYVLSTRGFFASRKIHLVGFSLGAHLSHFAAQHFETIYRKELNKTRRIGRISGLDPAGPAFQDYYNADESPAFLNLLDAGFVDIIHTSSMRSDDWKKETQEGRHGINKPTGHVDFYPNGGSNQPNCNPLVINCNHLSAPRYFSDSLLLLNNHELLLSLMSIQCDSHLQFNFGGCKNELERIKLEENGAFCNHGEIIGSMGIAALKACGKGKQYLDYSPL